MKHLILFLAIILLGCEFHGDCCVDIDTRIDFYVVDEKGNDLINQTREGTLLYSDLTVYYVIAGEEKKFGMNGYGYQSDFPRGFSINEPEGSRDKYSISLFPNSNEIPVSRTLLKWSDSKVDTIEATIGNGKSFTVIRKVVLNNQVVWDETDTTSRFFTLVR